MADMARKQVLEVLLLVLAALAVTVEFVGFISPGWLCLSVKYQNQSDGSDVSRWADDFDMTHWANKFEKNLADAFDDSGTDDRKRVRRQEARTSLTSAGERLHNATANNTSNWKGRPELPFKIFNSTQEEEVYKHFQQWVKNKNINNLSLPSNVTAFKKWLYSSNGQYLVLKKYFGEFSRNGSRAAPERFYFPVIESWLRGGADAEGQQDFKLPKFPDRTVTDVPGYKQAAIYKEFKSYVAPTIRAKLPNNYKYFITWMSQNMTRIQQMKVRYLYFMQDIDESKVDLYEHVIESWFIQALPHSATDGDQWADSLVALPMLSGMEWTVRLGIWYGKECVIIPGSTEDQCDNTNAVQLEQNGLDVGGMATWNDLRVETIIGLCACVIGLVGTLLTVKPFCLKGRQRVTTIVGICGMVLSCILFLVPIVRIAGIHSTLQHSYMFYHDELHVQMPWAAAVSGIGACLALVSAGCLAFFTWADERQKWNKFDDDPSIVFKNDVQRDKSTCDMDQKETSNTEGKYDNMATMSDI
ncbi:uncharacterized protein LOC123549248 [Mercenaria mercenaria]|uniref:uncharacterized protein LOC123549248 n=1 Tax=Mercenaria mercenaria TaxID=6596 RepID=UPI00234FACD7|nr:uncharacterized protein LOC123549248 [Mercenaria mercenaria]